MVNIIKHGMTHSGQLSFGFFNSVLPQDTHVYLRELLPECTQFENLLFKENEEKNSQENRPTWEQFIDYLEETGEDVIYINFNEKSKNIIHF